MIHAGQVSVQVQVPIQQHQPPQVGMPAHVCGGKVRRNAAAVPDAQHIERGLAILQCKLTIAVPGQVPQQGFQDAGLVLIVESRIPAPLCESLTGEVEQQHP